MQNFGEEKYLGKFHSDFQVFGGILSQRVESRTSIKTNFYKKRKKGGIQGSVWTCMDSYVIHIRTKQSENYICIYYSMK